MSRNPDIVIIGAGMVGATLAALLSDSGRRVLLADHAAPALAPADVVRVSALGRAAARILDAAGAWEALAAHATPYRAMQVWDHANDATVRFDAAEVGLEALGWIVPNHRVQASLMARIESSDAVECVWGKEVESFVVGEQGVQLRLGGSRVNTSLVIGADGARSRVRELAGIPLHQSDYGQLGIVATVTAERPHHDTAWQRFLPGGPVALLPLTDTRCSLVWSLPEDEARRVLELNDAAFCAALGEATGRCLGAITSTSARGGFPLARLHAHAYVTPRVALVGDAAHVVHPLAGQGANLGLLDAAALAEVLANERDSSGGVGEWLTLRRYARWRRAHNALTQESLDAIHHIFTSDKHWVGDIRGMGMKLVESLSPVKRQLALFATGEQGDLPRAARPRAGFR